MTLDGNRVAAAPPAKIVNKRAPQRAKYLEPLLVSLAFGSVAALLTFLLIGFTNIPTWALVLIAMLSGGLVLVFHAALTISRATDIRTTYLDHLKFGRGTRQFLLAIPVLSLCFAIGFSSVHATPRQPNLSPPSQQELDAAREVLRDSKSTPEQRGHANADISASGNGTLIRIADVGTGSPTPISTLGSSPSTNTMPDAGSGTGQGVVSNPTGNETGSHHYVYVYTGGGQATTAQTTVTSSHGRGLPGDFGIGPLLFPQMLIFKALGFGSSEKSTRTTLQTIQNFVTSQSIDENAVSEELRNLRPSQQREYIDAILTALDNAIPKGSVPPDVISGARNQLNEILRKVNDEKVVAKLTDPKIKSAVEQLVKVQDQASTADLVVQAVKPILGSVSPSALDDIELILVSREPVAWSKIKPKWDDVRQKLLAK